MVRPSHPTPQRGAAPRGPGRPTAILRALLAWALLLAIALPHAAAMDIEDETLADRPVSAVVIKGLKLVGEQEIRNNLRIAAGQPFDVKVAKADVSTLYRLGRFEVVNADATLLPDGSVEVTYTVSEQDIVRDIQFVGNKLVSDQELRKSVPLKVGAPRDDFLLEQSVFRIKELYRGRGNFLAEVSVDESRLAEDGILIFRIVEGPRVRIKEIEFVGNQAFDADQLSAQIKTKPWVFLFRKGELDDDLLVDDVATLDKWYKDRGYVDVRVDKRVEMSPEQREAKVVFVISEGRQYRLRDIVVQGMSREPLRVMTREQVANLAVIQRGDPLQRNLIEKTTKAISQAYEVMGYLEVMVRDSYVRVGEQAEVDLFLAVREGNPSTTGIVTVQGNFVTRDKVARRLVRMQPGRPLDGREIENTKKRLEGSQLFREPRITPQAPGPDDPDVRDVIVDVKEKQTGSVNFGIGAGTDSGFFGEVSVKQQNFDLFDWPKTMDEFIGGRAFRGAGQTFNLGIQPGIDVSNYNLSIGDPHLADSDWGGTMGVNYRTRVYDMYDEERLSGLFGISTKIGDFWSFSINPRIEQVTLSNFSDSTPSVIWYQRGPSFNSAVLFELTRTEMDNFAHPSRGSQVELQAGYHGVFGGDYDYPQVKVGMTQFFTTYEDFLGRKQVLRLRGECGYIFDDNAPVFERFYLGGRTLRGFAFRTVSPKATQVIGPDRPINPVNFVDEATNTPIGGNFLFFAGAQYEIPLVGEFLSIVFFVDSGTVNQDDWLNQYRVGAGGGLRIFIPQFGQAPIALDFAYPLLKQEYDQSQVFSFTIDLPF